MERVEAPMLQGERLILRAPRESDKADRLAAGRDPEIRRSYGGAYSADPPWTATDIERWYEETAQKPFSWIIDLSGRNIGGAGLHSIDESNRSARFAIGLLKRDDLSQGFGTEATRLVLEHAFDCLGMHRVDLRVLAYNQRAVRCYEKCGFTIEGTERETLLLDGEWQSDVIMSILEHEYRAISPQWKGTNK